MATVGQVSTAKEPEDIRYCDSAGKLYLQVVERKATQATMAQMARVAMKARKVSVAILDLVELWWSEVYAK